MENRLKQSLILSLLLSTISIYSQADKKCKLISTVITGKYTGKNLMFQNNETNGIQKMLLDGKEVVSNFNSTAFELPLDKLKKGQAFKLEIIYCDVKPVPYKILNEDAIK
jgi:hypothetical protein